MQQPLHANYRLLWGFTLKREKKINQTMDVRQLCWPDKHKNNDPQMQQKAPR